MASVEDLPQPYDATKEVRTLAVPLPLKFLQPGARHDLIRPSKPLTNTRKLGLSLIHQEADNDITNCEEEIAGSGLSTGRQQMQRQFARGGAETNSDDDACAEARRWTADVETSRS